MASLKVCMLLLKLNFPIEKMNGIFFTSSIQILHSINIRTSFGFFQDIDLANMWTYSSMA